MGARMQPSGREVAILRGIRGAPDPANRRADHAMSPTAGFADGNARWPRELLEAERDGRARRWARGVLDAGRESVLDGRARWACSMGVLDGRARWACSTLAA